MMICMCHELLSKIYHYSPPVHVSPTSRAHDETGEEEHDAKKVRVEEQKNKELECCVNSKRRSSEQ